MKQLEDSLQNLFEEYPMLATGGLFLALFLVAYMVGSLVKKGC